MKAGGRVRKLVSGTISCVTCLLVKGSCGGCGECEVDGVRGGSIMIPLQQSECL